MDEAERLSLKAEAADFRERARYARAEAVIPGLQPWRQGLLQDSAAYYDRRADEAERKVLGGSPAAEKITVPRA